jgi:hypothetical protein
MRGIIIDVYSENPYRVGDPQITIKNRVRDSFPFEYRFISDASKARIAKLIAAYSVSVDIEVYPLADKWYCSNQDHTRATFVRIAD